MRRGAEPRGYGDPDSRDGGDRDKVWLIGHVQSGRHKPAIFHGEAGEALAATVLAIILSVIAVVYSSRRSNEVQPVLTVEDVWGGMILGFLIGCLGNDFFQKIISGEVTDQGGPPGAVPISRESVPFVGFGWQTGEGR